MISSITTGYRKGIATIIDANVITLLTAFILFGLATAGRQGVRVHARRRHDRLAADRGRLHPRGARPARPQPDPALARVPRRRRGARPLALRLRRREQLVLLDLGRDPDDRRALVRHQAARLRHRLRVRDEAQRRPRRGRPRSTRSASRSAPPGSRTPTRSRSRRSRTPSSARTSSRSQGKIEPDQVGVVQRAARARTSATSRAPRRASRARSVGPTFGEQVARSAGYAIAFSLLLIAAYVAFRFEAKYAIPVMIAVVHDVLITAGVYSLVGREVSARHRRRVPDHPRLLALRHRDRLRPDPRERAAPAARDLRPDRQPLARARC